MKYPTTPKMKIVTTSNKRLFKPYEPNIQSNIIAGNRYSLFILSSFTKPLIAKNSEKSMKTFAIIRETNMKYTTSG